MAEAQNQLEQDRLNLINMKRLLIQKETERIKEKQKVEEVAPVPDKEPSPARRKSS